MTDRGDTRRRRALTDGAPPGAGNGIKMGCGIPEHTLRMLEKITRQQPETSVRRPLALILRLKQKKAERRSIRMGQFAPPRMPSYPMDPASPKRQDPFFRAVFIGYGVSLSSIIRGPKLPGLLAGPRACGAKAQNFFLQKAGKSRKNMGCHASIMM